MIISFLAEKFGYQREVTFFVAGCAGQSNFSG